MDINAVIAQVKTYATFFAGQVAGAANLSAALDKALTTTYPWAYVVPLGSEASENTSNNGIDQDVSTTVGIVVVLNNALAPADRRGQGSASQYPEARASLWSALLGWQAPPDYAPPGLHYLGDELVQQDIARAVYEFRFRQTVHLTEADGWQPTTTPLAAFDLSSYAVGVNPGIVTMTAGATIAPYQVVMTTDTGEVVPADPNSPDFNLAGIALEDAVPGQSLRIDVTGPVANPAWAWAGTSALYLGDDGGIVATAPTVGHVVQIGIAISPTTIYLSPIQPVMAEISIYPP